jgi:hypothetical protein
MLHTHVSSWPGTIGQIKADVPTGLSLTPPQEINFNKMDMRLDGPNSQSERLLLAGINPDTLAVQLVA